MVRWLVCCSCLWGCATLSHAGDSPRVISFTITIATGSNAKLGLTQEPAALARVVGELEAAQELSHVARIKFSTLEEQQSMIQFGEMISVAAGRSLGFGGSRGTNPGEPNRPQAITNYVREQVGTMVTTTARVAESTVIAEMSIEQSRFDQTRPVANESNTPPAKPVMQLKTSVSIPSDGAALLGGFETSIDGKMERTVVLVTAAVSGAGIPAEAVSDSLKVFTFQFVEGQAARELLQDLFPQRDFSIAVDERTNSLLVRGRDDILKTIEAILLRLDQSDVGRQK